MCVHVCVCVCVCQYVGEYCIMHTMCVCRGEGGKEVGMREEGVEMMGILKLNTVRVILAEN